MIKRFVAIGIILYVLVESYIFVGGFIQKQKLESKTKNSTAVTVPSDSSVPSNSTDQSGISNNNQQAKTFTTDQIAQHNNQSSCWLIISGKVYDVTDFLGQHPGGAGVILNYCGQDATQAFATQDGRGSHSSAATQELNSYLIGSVQ